MSKFFAGANITAQKLNTIQEIGGTNVALDEYKIGEFLESKILRKDPVNGLITDYAF